jgi:predicted ATPase/class 3 adenylate cyclase
MVEVPTGTVTFLFTDIEGSTRLWEDHQDAMKDALARHDAILRESVDGHDGVVFSTMGDGMAAAFASAPDAVKAVLDAQRRLGTEVWGETGPLRVRMGLHTDEGRLRAAGEYVNRPLNRCARLMAVAHGGQVLVSDVTAAVARDRLPADVVLSDLGEHRLRDLAEPVRIFQVSHPVLRRDFPPLRSLDTLPGNLPLQPTELVGRERDLADLAAVLRESRLVTLTGVGGVGKTRLALQLAAETLPSFRDGAWFCEFAPLKSGDAVPDIAAAVFSLQPSPGQTMTDALIESLRAKELLLVLDNCEHVLDAVAHLVERIERECPDVTVLATSREGLALRGERIVAVPSLAQDDASRLFADRAADVQAGFSLNGENEAAVQRLCERLDGIPLAIELAAARVRSMTVSELNQRLDDRFRLLTGGSRTALERHQTLRATVDWSYDLLSPPERVLLDRLAVFAGGFMLDAAQAVAGGDDLDSLDVLDLLAQLVDKSLVIAEQATGATRYRLLETIRQYAQERLEASDTDAELARRRHAEHYVTFAEVAAPHLRGRDQLEWVERLVPELDNIRALVAWTTEAGEVDLAFRLVMATNVNGLSLSQTALGWAEAACAMPRTADHPMLPDVLGWAAWSAVNRADMDRSRELIAEMHAAEQRLNAEPSALRLQGPTTLALFGGEIAKSIEHAERWVELARAAADDYQLVQGLTILGSAYLIEDPELAVRTLEEAVDLGRSVGAPGILSWALSVLGTFLVETNRPEALSVLTEAAEYATLVGNAHAAAHALTMAASIHGGQGEHDVALRMAATACDEARRVGTRLGIGGALFATATSLSDLGDHESAVMLAAFATAIYSGQWAGRVEAARRDLLGAATDALGAERVAELDRRGTNLTDEEAATLARDASEHALRV